MVFPSFASYRRYASGFFTLFMSATPSFSRHLIRLFVASLKRCDVH